MHHVTRVTVLGVGLGPMAESEIVVVVDLVGKTRHVGVFRELFCSVEMEPRVPCVCVLGLVLVLVGEEFDGSTFADFWVFDPIAWVFAMPLGGSFNMGGEVVCCMTFDGGVDFSRVSEYYVYGCQLCGGF